MGCVGGIFSVFITSCSLEEEPSTLTFLKVLPGALLGDNTPYKPKRHRVGCCLLHSFVKDAFPSRHCQTTE